MYSLHAQKVAIIGVNHTPNGSVVGDPDDGISILALEDLTAGEVYYFTENEYDNPTNQFVDINESVLKITINSTITKGNVIFIEEEFTPNTFSTAVTAGSGSVTVTYIAASGNFLISSNGESLYLYTDTDDDPSNGVTEVHSAFFAGAYDSGSGQFIVGGFMPTAQNPSSDYPNAIIIHNFPSNSGIDRVEYNTSVADRTDVNKVKLENGANYVFNGAHQDLSTTKFTNFSLVTSNPTITLTKNTSELDENSGSNFSFTFTTSIAPTSDLVINFDINDGITSGKATFGSDFTQSGATSMDTTSGTVTIASGTTSKIVTINLTGDTTLEPDETLKITVSSGTGYDAGSPSTQTTAIINDDTLTVIPDVAIAGTSHYTDNEDGISSFSFVALKDLAASSSYVFSSNPFEKNTLLFSDVSTYPSELKWTAPSGGVSRGDVIVVKKTASNTFTVTRNGSATLPGTVSKLSPSKKFYISEFEGFFRAHTDTDDNPYNGITAIHSQIFTYEVSNGFGGNMPTSLDLSTLYVGSVLVDGFANTTPNRLEYDPTLRPITIVDQASFENPANWLYGEAMQDLSPIPFNGIIISEGSTNPNATVSVSSSSIIEDTETATYTFSLDAAATSDITVNFSVVGSATFTTDYTVTGANSFTATTGSIIIPNGLSSAQLVINPVTDAVLEKKEDLLLTITSGTGYNGGSPGSATVNITNDDANNDVSQLAIIGINHESPTSMTLVAMEDIPANSTFYFLRNQFDKETLSFQSGGKYKLVTPNSCTPKGTVLTITGGLNGPLIVNCNGTSGTTACGTATIEGSGNVFDFLDIGTRYHAFQDDDDDHTNGIKQIHSVFHTGGTYPSNHTGGTLTSEENPKSVYANAVVVDGFPIAAPNRTEFDATKRASDVTTALVEDISNYVHGQTNAVLSETNFNVIAIKRAYVNINTAAGNGTSWATAYNSLQDALNNASSCYDNEIWVANGTYKPHATDELIAFSVPENTSIYGGFNGTETLVSERNWNTNQTILSGDLNSSDSANAGDSHTIVRISTDNIVLDGFIVEYGYADGSTNFSDRYGAGIFIRSDSDPQPENTQVINCIIRNNHAPGNGSLSTGGGVALYGNNHSFTNCLFHDNSSKDNGGGLALRIATNLKVTNCTFTQNHSEVGGGLHIHTANTLGTSEVINSIFESNTTTSGDNKNLYNLKSTNVVNLSYSLMSTGLPARITDLGNNILSSDPLFFDSSNNDFSLEITSPAINSGSDVVNAETKDLTGNTRKTGIIDIGTYEYENITEWLGTTDSNWNDSNNWGNGIPSATISALFKSGITNQPNVTITDALAKDIVIKSGATLSVHADKSLTVKGNFTNDGSFIITSDATNSGSFILEGNYVGASKVEYQRYVTDNWHLISSPLDGQNISSLINIVDVIEDKYTIATYDNSVVSESRYKCFTNGAGDNPVDVAGFFTKGKGYSVKKTSSGIISFQGILNTIDVSISITDNSSGVGNKWNLVGNPFTAAIAINDDANATNNFLTVNAAKLNPSRVAVYQWNANTDSYDIFNHATGVAKYIAPGQGFFIESKTGGETITFLENLQSHQTGQIFLKTNQSVPEINLIISGGTTTKSTQLKYLENTSTGLDVGYDAGVFSENKTDFNVFTHLISNSDNVDFALQCLPNSNYEAMVVPIGIIAEKDKEIIFSTTVKNLPENVRVYLEDKENSTFTRLDEFGSNYTVQLLTEQNGIGRFYLHTKSEALNIDDIKNDLDNIRVYKLEDKTLRISGLRNGMVHLRMFDALGKQILKTKFLAKRLNDIELPNILTGVYIINIQSENGKVNKKVILK